ncbi:MAG: P-II family nitrogen regulator [Thermodesulfobacteriota bacterium]
MKEIVAIIRQNRINQTKESLIAAGFPAATATRALGRGRRPVEFDLLNAINENPKESAEILPTLAQGGRLYPKRIISMVVPDEKVAELIRTIIKVNQTGNPGDGKVFVCPINDVIRVRTGETGPAAIDEMNGSDGR